MGLAVRTTTEIDACPRLGDRGIGNPVHVHSRPVDACPQLGEIAAESPAAGVPPRSMPVRDWRWGPVRPCAWSVDAFPQLVCPRLEVGPPSDPLLGRSMSVHNWSGRAGGRARSGADQAGPASVGSVVSIPSPQRSRRRVVTTGRFGKSCSLPSRGHSRRRSRRPVRHPSGCVAQSKTWQDPLPIGPRHRPPTRSRTPSIESRRVASPRRGTTSECSSRPRVRRSNVCSSRSI